MTNGMALALVLKPILLFAFFIVLVAPINWAFLRFFPDGQLKRRLTRRLGP